MLFRRQKDNSKILEKIPLIESVKRILISKDLENILGPQLTKIAKRNSPYIFVYKITYHSQGHKVNGFIIEPRKGSNLPSIIFNRGGSGEFSALKISYLFSNTPAELAKEGYIVIASQYSGNAGSGGVDEMGGSEIEDVLVLQKILEQYSRADETKVGMYGTSRGGMMTYLALSKVDWIKAAVTIGGAANLFLQEKLRPKMIEHFKKMFGGSEEEKQKRSVVFWAHHLSKQTPILIMHGQSDWRVSPLESLELSQKLLEQKIPHRLVVFEGADHGLKECAAEATKMTIDWFDRFLKHDESIPNTEPHGA